MTETQKCWQMFMQTGHPAAYLEYQRSKSAESAPAGAFSNKDVAFPYNMVLEL